MLNKRIAMISFHTCPLAYLEGKETGGMNVYVLELSKALVKKGYQVDIYTRIQDLISPEIVNLNANLRVIHLKAGPKKAIDKKLWPELVGVFSNSLNKYIKKNHLAYDIIHAHYYLSGLIALKIVKQNKHKIPLVMTFHTLALMKNLVARNNREKESKLRISAEFKLIQQSDHITASSKADLEYLTHLYECPEEKISLIHPGVDTKIFYPIPRQEALDYIQSITKDKIILYVGRLEALKGIDVLMHALKILLNKNSEYKLCLLIVGGKNGETSSEFTRLKALQKTLHISPIVGFVSQRNQHELPYYYNSAEIVVMASHYESFGMSALEAMACGVPVIISQTSGISSLIDPELNSLIVSAHNPLQLANQIEKVLSDSNFSARYKSIVLPFVSSMSWEKVAENMSTVYNNK